LIPPKGWFVSSLVEARIVVLEEKHLNVNVQKLTIRKAWFMG
jgi:hypothetical protein